MDAELRALLGITRHLPRVKGAGRVAMILRRWYLRRPRGPVVARVNGIRMRLSPEQYVDGWLLFAPVFYERDELRSLMSVLRPGDVFVDVGAHIGLYTLLAARHVGTTGVVLAIEPNARSANELRHNVGLNALANVRVAEVAAADASGMRVLAQTMGSNRAGATLLGGECGGADVLARPLPEIMRDHGIHAASVMKLDIEGAEHEVLSRFLADVAPAQRPRALMIEHYPSLAARAGDALALLIRAGYRVTASYGVNHILEATRSA